MAAIYVRSGAGGSNNGTSWANAYISWVTAAAAATTADTIYIAEDHAETAAASKTVNFSGGTSAVQIPNYCVNHSGSVPPVAADLATTGQFSVTGASSITVTGNAYVYGMIFNTASGSSTGNLTIGASGYQRYDACTLKLITTANVSIKIGDGSSAAGLVVWNNTTVSFASTGQFIGPNGSNLTWRNTASAIAGSVPANLFKNGASAGGAIVCDGVDLSAVTTGNNLVSGTTISTLATFNFRNCKLASGVTVSTTPGAPDWNKTDLEISDNTSHQYRQERYRYQGTLTTETTFVRSGGASDGTTPISWKVASSTNAAWVDPFECFQIAIWNNTTGASKTATIEIENGGVTLTNAQVWVEVEYLGSSATPVASVVSSGIATGLTTAANLPTSSTTWNGSLGSAVKQYLQVTFTPNMVGYVRATVYVGAASQTLYIDPLITIA